MKSALVKLAKTNVGQAINDKLSRQLGHTNTGIQFHIAGNKQMKEARKFFTGDKNAPQSDTAKEFHTVGSAAKTAPYPQELIDTIKTKFANLIESEENYICDVSADYKGPKDVRRVLKEPLERLPELADLIDNNVRAQIEDFYKSHFTIREIVAWRNYHIPEEYASGEALSNFWHFDQITTALFQMFVNISDVTENDGPFHAQTKSRSDQIMKMGFKKRSDYGLPIDVMEDPKYIRKHIGPAGSAMYCKTPVCLHRADIPAKGHYRDLVSFHILPSNSPLPEDWAINFKKK